MSFLDCLDKFIRRILITDSLLSFIGAFTLIGFHNKIDHIDLFQRTQSALNIVKDYMISQSIIIIEQLIFSLMPPAQKISPI